MATPSKKGGASWDEAEKYQFLLKILGQVGGGSINSIHPKMDKIFLNGRTPKALTLMWGKIRQEALEAGGADGDGEAPPATPKKRKAKGNATTPASKKRTPASGKKGKSKKYVSDDSEPEEPIDLGDTSEEEKPGKEEFEEMEEFGEDDYVATATKEEETEV